MARASYRLSELADLVGGDLTGNGDIRIRGVAGIEEAEPGEITFLASSNYERFLPTTQASAVIGPTGLKCAIPSIHLDNPYLGFVKVVSVFAENLEPTYAPGVHPTAIVDPSAKLGKNVSIGPYCHIQPGARIDDNSIVLLGGYVGHDVMIGKDCMIYPNVTIRERARIGDRVMIHPGAVIGADGFGFAREGDQHRKIPHIGNVVIEDDVEIGANTTIDRATTGVTRVGRGTKLDNLVQIAHNVIVGENAVLAGQSGVSGSTEVGNRVVIAGQAGLVGHVKIGDDVVIGAQAGVTKSIPAGTTVSGYPAREHGQVKKLYGFTTRLPELHRRVQELEKKVHELESEKRNVQATEDDC